MKTQLLGTICFSSLIFLSSISHGSAIYRYQGENYENPVGVFDTTMSLTGTVEFATPLAASLFGEVFPIGFRFNDGVNTFTAEDFESARFGFATDPLGKIIGWEMYLNLSSAAAGGFINLTNTILGGSDVILVSPFDGSEPGIVLGNPPGSWSLVPIPPAIWLFGSGLLGLVGIARRKKAA